MKELFSEKGHIMLKFAVNQFAMSIFGIMIAFAAVAANEKLLIPFGIFSSLFFFFLIYYFIWEDGAKDAIRAGYGKIKEDRFCSLKYCFIAHLPSLICVILYIILNVFGSGNTAESIKSILIIIISFFMYGMFMGISRGLALTFGSTVNIDGVETKVFSFVDNGYIYIIFSIITMAVVFFAYYFGLKNIRFTKKKTER